MSDNHQLKFVEDNADRDFDLESSNQHSDRLTGPNPHPVNSLLPIEDDQEPSADPATDSSDPEPQEEPALVQTQHSLVTSPWSRTIVVSGVFGTGFLLIFLFLNPMFNRYTARRDIPNPTPPASTAKEFAQPDGDVYAKLALARQAEELAALKEANKPSPAKAPSKEHQPTVNRTHPRQPQAESPPPTPNRPKRVRVVRAAPLPAPPPQRRVLLPQPHLVPRGLPQIVRLPAPPPVTPVPAKLDREIKPTDPWTELARLRAIGSAGRIEYGEENPEAGRSFVTRSATNRPHFTQKDTLANLDRGGEVSQKQETINLNRPNTNGIEQLKPRWKAASSRTAQNQSLPPSSDYSEKQNITVETEGNYLNRDNNISDPTSHDSPDTSSIFTSSSNYSTPHHKTASQKAPQYLSSEENIILGRSPQYLVVGTSARAILETPLVRSQDENSSQNARSTNFVAQLTQPLLSHTGAEAIKAGSRLSIEILSIDQSSAVQAQVTSIIQEGTEYPVPAGAITVTGANGYPLTASLYDDKGPELASADATLGVLSGLSRVGEAINQPEVQDDVEEELPDGRVRRRTRSQARDRTSWGGAFLAGAFGAISEKVSDRTDKATTEIMNRPNIWVVRKGKEVAIQVNRSLQL